MAWLQSRAEPLERRVLLDGGSILADINRTTDQLDPENMVAVGDVVYFAGRPQVAGGPEVYKTDGTTEGTVLVREIVPGLAGGDPKNFTAVNGTVFFSATDPTGGRELWKTDGTAPGTVRVKDIRPGAGDANPLNLTVVGDTLFFSADDGANGAELWKSDGTEAGTIRVKDIVAGSSASGPAFMVSFNGTLLFQAGPSGGKQLWRSDGTPEGTTVLNGTSGVANSNPRQLTVMGDAVYFVADPGFSSRGDLFRTDGTPEGTYRVKQINLNSTDDTSLLGFVASDNLLYFLANNTIAGQYQLWRSDGTDAGTFFLANGSAWNAFTRVTPLGNGWAVFPNRTTAAGNEPWVSDGTPEGTGILTELNPGTGDGVSSFIGQRIGSQVYFSPNNVYGVAELWVTDGFPWDTSKVADVTDVGGVLWSQAALNDKLLFSGLRFVGEGDLYVYDPSAGAVTRIGATQGTGQSGDGYSMSDLTAANEQSQAFYRAGPYFYFEANDGITGDELWRTNPGAGPGEPTAVQVADIDPGGRSSDPAGFIATDDGTFYFTATTLDSGRELYRILPGGMPEMVKNLAPGAASSAPRQLSPVGNLLYFNARESDNGFYYLWRYDPASGSVTKVIPYPSNTPLQSPSSLVRAGGFWYFAANGPSNTGRELYRTDGTALGTRMVKDVLPGSGSSYPDSFAALGDTLYFAATNSAGKQELWKTDGTDAGTVKVSDFGATAAADSISGIYSRGGVVYVARSGTGSVPGIWKSDGTAAGTVKISGVSSNGQFAGVGDSVFFTGTDTAGGTGTGAYRYDPVGGTITRLTTPPGTTGFVPSTLYAAGGDVYAIGTSNNRGQFELWRIDGDAPAGAGAAAASLVRVLGPRVVGGILGGYYVLGRLALASDEENLYFAAYDPATGMEPYRLTLAGQPSGGYVVGRAVTSAAGKEALLPGYTATFSNVTSASRGINGLTVDLTGVPAAVSPAPADFDFAVMNGSSGTWVPMAGSATVTFRRGQGSGGSDRAVITLPNNTARNAWLRVTVKANSRTGLLKPDVFYMGNLVGDTGSTGTAAVVNGQDLTATRANLGTTDPAARSRFDFNGDGRVNVLDLNLVRANQRRTLPFLAAPIATTTSSAAAASASVAVPAAGRTSSSRRSAWAEQIEGGSASI